ncbi:hypothetical protein AB0J90_04940 [Micromonospora sp. NPDC049523]|uniref:hypothetical protein n=1 Tax=Micromonospora sp. NPDC049523 TaxID=3155921 RepID=UPI00343B69B7
MESSTTTARSHRSSRRSPWWLAAVAGALVLLVLVGIRILPGGSTDTEAVARWDEPAGPIGAGGAPSAGGTATPTGSASALPSATPSASPTRSPGRSPSGSPTGKAAPPLSPLGVRPTTVKLDLRGWWAWSIVNRRTGAVSGSANMGETSTTASLIKAWLTADYLRRAAADGVTPTEAKLADLTKIIRDSDNTRTETLFTELGRIESINRLLGTCKLTDSSPAADGGWSRTALSARDTARLGVCIADGRAAGDKWTTWLLNEMRLVRGVGDFGIRHAFPAAQRKTIAIKNGWVERTKEQEYHVNCLAISGDWTMGVMTRYPVALGWDYGMDNCQKIAEQLRAPA